MDLVEEADVLSQQISLFSFALHEYSELCRVMFQQMCIIGPGLLGASLAIAAKQQGLAASVCAWSRRPETREKCLRQAWCDQVADTAAEAVAGADFVVLCTPVATIPGLLEAIAPALRKGALVTDVGSTKAIIVKSGQAHLSKNAHFIGAHPMAGSEQGGMEHARSNLFTGATCFVTPLPENPPEVVEKLVKFWEALNMRVVSIDPEMHDQVVAHISHLPHLLASSLCAYLATKDGSWGNYAGGGLRDTTRIASGDAALWRDILTENRAQVLGAIEGFEATLSTLKARLSAADDESVKALLAEGKTFRDQLPSPASDT